MMPPRAGDRCAEVKGHTIGGRFSEEDAFVLCHGGTRYAVRGPSLRAISEASGIEPLVMPAH